LAGGVLAIFYYIHPQVGGPFAMIAYVVVALGGFGSIFGALAAGIIVGLVEAFAAIFIPSSMKAVAIYSLYLAVVFIRPRGLFGRL
jgi:branched-chain amino acid transport system permease protein